MDHKYQVFASEIATTERKEALTSFFQLAKSHDWEGLVRRQAFDGAKDAVQICAVSCPTGDVSVLYVRDPFEPLESTMLEDWEALEAIEAAKWQRTLRAEGWITFGPSAQGG